jgi:hypothetical protein
MIKRKGQEEIVGFVVIVVLISVVLVVFLGIFLRQEDPDRVKESLELYQFLESLMKYTSDCAISYEPAYLEMGELLQECRSGIGSCTNGKDPCEVFEKEVKEILDFSFNIGEESFYKGYEFSSIYSNNRSDGEVFLSLKKGECEISYRGSEILIPAFPGSIANSLKLCF